MTTLLRVTWADRSRSVAYKPAFQYLLAIALLVIASSAALADECPRGGVHWRLDKGSCEDETCREAANDLFCTAGAMDFALTPNTMAFTKPIYALQAQRDYYRIVSKFPYTHPRRVPLYCSLLRRLAALTPDVPRQDGDNSVYFINMLAVRVWPFDHTCPAQVKAAYPDTPTMRTILADQGVVCLDRPRSCQPAIVPPELEPKRRRRAGH